MKSYFTFFIIILLLSAGFSSDADAASPDVPALKQAAAGHSTDSPAPGSDQTPAKATEQKARAIDDEYTDDEAYDEKDDTFKEERVTIADPIEPFNRAMHTFNDKMYFWLLKPVASGYKVAVPEPARISVKNFFTNLKYPSRFVSCLMQTDFAGAATETGRFAINTIWGIGGLMDPASGGELKIPMQDTDLGQALGVYGVGHGFYIVWPILGPSSPRDSVDIIGDQVLYPLSFLNIWYASLSIKAFETVNKTSLRLGEYESLVEAAIDPYISIRDAYVQYRAKDVKARKTKSLLFKDNEDGRPKTDGNPKE